MTGELLPRTHSISVVRQSPVRQEKMPVKLSVEQSVRAQMAPVHDLGTDSVFDSLLLRIKPLGVTDVPVGFDVIAGHIVLRHWLTIVNSVDCTAVC